MSGVCHFLLGWCILGCITSGSWAWKVDLPSNIKAMLGSCVIIPCSFDYYENPPTNPYRVVWYQYVNRGYPLVYDSFHMDNVIDQFRGRTSRVNTFSGGKECSLRISRVTWGHDKQRIYPWVDPENIGRGTYRFFDKTVTIEVTNRAEKPEMMISGEMRVGNTVTVQCSVVHTCFTDLPILSLSIQLKEHKLNTVSMADGTSKTTLTTKLNLVKDHQTVTCSVTYIGGQRAETSKAFDVKCSFWPVTIKSPDEFPEGQPRQVTCTAEYTCPQLAPTIKWSYGSMPASTNVVTISPTLWKSVSTLTFTASANDNGRSLTCVTQFTGGQKQEASITLRVKRTISSTGWSFTTPDSVKGMKGSCVIIPCRFTYHTAMPADLRVIWYLFNGNQYLPVFDERQTVNEKYRGRTSLTGAVRNQDCSLKIDKLDEIRGQDRLFPWIDKNPISFYHMEGFSFYDKTTQIVILDHAPEPQLNLAGIPRVGEESRVSCSVQHTCSSSPPLITISNIPGSDNTTNTEASKGVWEKTVERVWTPKEEDQSVKCTVHYQGGQTATSELKLNVECMFKEINITKLPSIITEGVAQSVICSVVYKCKKYTPTIVWNYNEMKSFFSVEKVSRDTFRAQSNLTFIGSLDDDGQTLTCTARFITAETSDSKTIHVKKYEKQPEVTRLNEAFHPLAGEVPFRFAALTQSCVVIPCSFQQQENSLITKGVWTKQNGDTIYHNAQNRVIDHFKGRTRILGEMGKGNCSLEIDDVNAFDNGPFCFHAEQKNQKYRFNNSCVFLVMKATPEKPSMTQIPEEVDAGAVVTVSCSVTHTCSSHPPEFSWSVSELTREATHTFLSQGTWKTTSTITFLADGGDGEKSLTCTATYWGNRKQSSTAQLTVKGSLSFQLRRSLPVTIPVSVLVLIGIILAGVVIFKWRQSRKPPPRPERRRSLWERLSSFSRPKDNSVAWRNNS